MAKKAKKSAPKKEATNKLTDDFKWTKGFPAPLRWEEEEEDVVQKPPGINDDPEDDLGGQLETNDDEW